MRFREGIIGLSAVILAGSPANAAGDVNKGKSAYVRCAACHAVSAGKNGIGPSLAGIVGRKAGSVSGFTYSQAMKKAAVEWDVKTLDSFLAAPSKQIPANRMPFAGISDPKMRQDLITYLATLK